jgi:chromosome segregation ATPase
MADAVGRKRSRGHADHSNSTRNDSTDYENINESPPRNNRSVRSKDATIQTEKPLIPELQKQPDVLNRNKRMFAGLMGHLDSARKRLHADSSSIVQRNQALEAARQKNQDTIKAISESIEKKENQIKRKVV